MIEGYYTKTYITEWKDKDNVIISLWHLNERDDAEHVGVVELAVYKNVSTKARLLCGTSTLTKSTAAKDLHGD